MGNQESVQDQYAINPESYVTFEVHAKGQSLTRLRALLQPEPGWRILDIATGGGHVARLFADENRLVIASDLTYPMLKSARKGAGESTLMFCQTDATATPFPNGTFDLVTCRIAAHHFPDVHTFLGEVARILKPTGQFALVDNVSSGEPTPAKDYNAFEALRDPSHYWAHSLDDWNAYMARAGLKVVHQETLEKSMDFDAWAARMGVEGDDLTRLRVLLLKGPASLRDWLRPIQTGNQITFHLTEGVFIAQKHP